MNSDKVYCQIKLRALMTELYNFKDTADLDKEYNYNRCIEKTYKDKEMAEEHPGDNDDDDDDLDAFVGSLIPTALDPSDVLYFHPFAPPPDEFATAVAQAEVDIVTEPDDFIHGVHLMAQGTGMGWKERKDARSIAMKDVLEDCLSAWSSEESKVLMRQDLSYVINASATGLLGCGLLTRFHKDYANRTDPSQTVKEIAAATLKEAILKPVVSIIGIDGWVIFKKCVEAWNNAHRYTQAHIDAELEPMDWSESTGYSLGGEVVHADQLIKHRLARVQDDRRKLAVQVVDARTEAVVLHTKAVEKNEADLRAVFAAQVAAPTFSWAEINHLGHEKNKLHAQTASMNQLLKTAKDHLFAVKHLAEVSGSISECATRKLDEKRQESAAKRQKLSDVRELSQWGVEHGRSNRPAVYEAYAVKMVNALSRMAAKRGYACKGSLHRQMKSVKDSLKRYHKSIDKHRHTDDGGRSTDHYIYKRYWELLWTVEAALEELECESNLVPSDAEYTFNVQVNDSITRSEYYRGLTTQSYSSLDDRYVKIDDALLDDDESISELKKEEAEEPETSEASDEEEEEPEGEGEEGDVEEAELSKQRELELEESQLELERIDAIERDDDVGEARRILDLDGDTQAHETGQWPDEHHLILWKFGCIMRLIQPDRCPNEVERIDATRRIKRAVELLCPNLDVEEMMAWKYSPSTTGADDEAPISYLDKFEHYKSVYLYDKQPDKAFCLLEIADGALVRRMTDHYGGMTLSYFMYRLSAFIKDKCGLKSVTVSGVVAVAAHILETIITKNPLHSATLPIAAIVILTVMINWAVRVKDKRTPFEGPEEVEQIEAVFEYEPVNVIVMTTQADQAMRDLYETLIDIGWSTEFFHTLDKMPAIDTKNTGYEIMKVAYCIIREKLAAVPPKNDAGRAVQCLFEMYWKAHMTLVVLLERHNDALSYERLPRRPEAPPAFRKSAADMTEFDNVEHIGRWSNGSQFEGTPDMGPRCRCLKCVETSMEENRVLEAYWPNAEDDTERGDLYKYPRQDVYIDTVGDKEALFNELLNGESRLIDRLSADIGLRGSYNGRFVDTEFALDLMARTLGLSYDDDIDSLEDQLNRCLSLMLMTGDRVKWFVGSPYMSRLPGGSASLFRE